MASSVMPTRGMGVDRSSAKIVSNTVASFSHVIVGSMSSVGSQRNLQAGGVCASAGVAASTRETNAIAYLIMIVSGVSVNQTYRSGDRAATENSVKSSSESWSGIFFATGKECGP